MEEYPTQQNTHHILASLLEARTGQTITPSRYWRIQSSLAPILKKHTIPDLDALVAVLAEPDNDALVQETLEAMLNNESFFYRDTNLFRTIENVILPTLHEARGHKKILRIWSAGCSTGQEIYSLAMLLKEQGEKWKDWKINLTASDISETVLGKARKGIYTQFEIQRGLPVDKMLKYFTQKGDVWQINDDVRKMVHFRQDNLLKNTNLMSGYDIILCRNVLMYFSQETRHIAYRRLVNALAPDGRLMLGVSETLTTESDWFIAEKGQRGIYMLSGKYPETKPLRAYY